MTRWKAATVHLLISAGIAIGLFSLVFFIWYPEPYFEAAGARFLWVLLVAVDVVIGPVLTLIVFKPGKRGLKFDLSVIAAAQLAAFVYGFLVIVQARPAFVVFTIDRFNIVPANYVVTESLHKAKYEMFSQLPWRGPVLAAARKPEDKERSDTLLFTALSGFDLETFPEFYAPYDDLKANAVTRGKQLTDLYAKHPDKKSLIEAAVTKLGKKTDEVLFLPLTATRRDMAMLIDAKTGDVLTAVPVDPWGV